MSSVRAAEHARPAGLAGLGAVARRLLSRTRLSLWEGTCASAGLLGIGLVIFGPHVARGGFVEDDWNLAAIYR